MRRRFPKGGGPLKKGAEQPVQGRMWGNEYRTTVVCVDSYEQSVLTGRLYNPYLSEGRTFDSLMEFLRVMEELLNGMNFPQPFTTVRSFQKPQEQEQGGRPEAKPHEGELGTFSVRVIFRQNSSWQGSVTWLERGVEESFRSALELLLLMDSALREI